MEAAGTTTFGYDLEGQIASKGPDAYTFDYEHRLTTAVVAGQQSAFSYDGKGNRLKAVRNGVTTKYVYDMNSNALAEADGSNNIKAFYIYGNGSLLAVVTLADAVYSYHFNAIGSTVAITDQSQNIVNAYSYASFGRILNQTEAIPQPFKYVGQYGVLAEPNGFYYMRARYYDPKVGRFISEDPIGFEGGTVNLYEYVGGNPVNWIDPLGLAGDRYDICDNNKSCKKVIDFACNFFGVHTQKICCKVDFDNCIAEAMKDCEITEEEKNKCLAKMWGCNRKLKNDSEKEPLTSPPGSDRFPTPPYPGPKSNNTN